MNREHDSVDLSLEVERLIDRLCDRFEIELQQEAEPDIDAYLAKVEEGARPTLRNELAKLLRAYCPDATDDRLQLVAHLPLEVDLAGSTLGPRRDGGPTVREPVKESIAEFQRALERGESVCIEDRIAAAAQSQYSTLLSELLTVEMAHRAAHGEKPLPGEYRARFPADWQLVKNIYREHFLPPNIGDFSIVRLIGRGGHGHVYLANDTKLERQVAVKVFRRDQQGMQLQANLLHEARAAAKLRHENIVTVFGVHADEDGDEFLVLDYVDGSSLEELLHEQRLTADEAAELMLSVAHALQHAHDQQLVHRDLKPANILLDPARRPRVTDFGLALRMTGSRCGREMAGTLRYMAPEQVCGETHLLDGRTDLWAVGVILYRALAGVFPFKGVDREDTVELIKSADPLDVRAWDPSVPRELSRIVQRCLMKRMSDRYQSAGELAEDLSAFLASVASPGDLAGAATGPPIAPKGLRRFEANDRESFLHLVPGPRDRHGVPEKVRFWDRHLRCPNSAQTFRVGLMYGPSGSGKSSLLRAGILARLPVTTRWVVIDASAADTEELLRRAIRNVLPQIPEEIELTEIVGRLREGEWLPAGEKLVLVIDQFEQWLHARRQETSSTLVQALRHCDGGRIQALLLARDDFWMPAVRFFHELDISVSEGINAAAVDLFDRDHAAKVLTAFGKACGRIPANQPKLPDEFREFTERAVDELIEGDWIVPVRIAILVEMIKGKPWQSTTLDDVGGSQGLGIAFLTETFEGRFSSPANRPHLAAAKAVLEKLLPPPGIDLGGHLVPASELQSATEIEDRKEFNSLLIFLDRQLHLISPIEPESCLDRNLSEGEQDERERNVAEPQDRPYQLTHDFLVPAVRGWLNQDRKRSSRGRAEIRLGEYAAAYAALPDARQLPSWWEWLGMLLLTRRKSWTAAQQRMMRAATQRNSRAAMLGIGLVLAVAGVIYQRTSAARTDGLVQALASCDSRDLPRAVANLHEYRWWSVPRLLAMLADDPLAPDQRGRILLGTATFGELNGQDQALADYVLSADPPMAAMFAKVLRQHGQLEYLRPGMSEVALNAQAPSAQRLRAMLVLAQHRSEDTDPILSNFSEDLVSILLQSLSDNPRFFETWSEGFKPIKRQLTEPLCRVYRGSTAPDDQRLLAANLLSRYLRDFPDQLVQLALDGNPKQFEIVADTLGTRIDSSRDELIRLAQWSAPSSLAEEEKDRQARRQANAVMLLRQAGDATALWRGLDHQPDPRLQSFLIDHLRQAPADLELLYRQLKAVENPAVRQALILALAQSAQRLPGGLEEFVEVLLKLHRDDADSGVHSACEWALRQLGQQDKLTASNQALAQLGLRRDFGWYVTKSGMAMIVVPAPGVIEVGSPASEPYRDASNEELQGFEIGWSYAISALEVTQAEFLALCPENTRSVNDTAPTPQCPANVVSWPDANRYCRLLSEQDGVAEDQMVVPPASAVTKGHYADFRTHSGYRLPVEAEWEYVCRAGTTSPRFFGYAPNLLPVYCCYIENSHGMLSPVGTYLPNRWGAFDMLGNVAEWCYNAEPTKLHPFRANGFALLSRYMVRGNDYRAIGKVLRTANRSDEDPATLLVSQGFRIAHTILPNPLEN